MRLKAITLVLPLVFLACSDRLAATEFPFVAFAKASGAAVRSGPAEKFYATQQLNEGEQVVVYRIDQKDWYAIRPPTSSFSWVQRKYVTTTESADVIKIVGNKARTFVGSRVNVRNRNVRYIRLRDGERLQLFQPGQKLDSKWVKVHPPAGEFRWIHKSLVSLTPEVEPATGKTTSNEVRSDSVRTSSAKKKAQATKPKSTKNQQADQTVPRKTTVSLSTEGMKLAESKSAKSSMATEPIAVEPPEPKKKIERSPAVVQKKQTPEPLPVEGWSIRLNDSSVDANVVVASHETTVDATNQQATADSVASNSNVKSNNTATALNRVSVRVSDQSSENSVADTNPAKSSLPSLSRVSLALSNMVAKEPLAWKLGPIRRSTERIIDRSDSSATRSQARELLRRISEFEALQLRFSKNAHLTPNAARQTIAQASYQQPVASRQTRTVRPAQAARGIANSRYRYPGQKAVNQQSAPNQRTAANPPVSRQAQTNNPFDGHGYLMPVLTNRRDVPKFALTDENGGILSFVSPRSGLNLRPYLRKQVGVIGEQGYLSSLKKPHLSVSRVVVLERHSRQR